MEVSIDVVCRSLEVPRSRFYREPRKMQCNDDEMLLAKIEKVVLCEPGSGTRRVSKSLSMSGTTIGRRRVQRIMRENSLLCHVKKLWTKTTNSTHGHKRYTNLIKGLLLSEPDRVFVSDITYIPLPKGFCFLAVVLDAFTRKVVGYNVSRNIDAELPIKALRNALRDRKPKAGWIHHSDQGVQYACNGYTDLVLRNNGQISMSSTGSPTQNAKAESFFASLKKEYVHLERFETFESAKNGIYRYINGYYNTRRLHSSLGYMSPVNYEKSLNNRVAA